MRGLDQIVFRNCRVHILLNTSLSRRYLYEFQLIPSFFERIYDQRSTRQCSGNHFVSFDIKCDASKNNVIIHFFKKLVLRSPLRFELLLLDIRTLCSSSTNSWYRSFGGRKSYWSQPASNVRFGLQKYNIRDSHDSMLLNFSCLADMYH